MTEIYVRVQDNDIAFADAITEPVPVIDDSATDIAPPLAILETTSPPLPNDDPSDWRRARADSRGNGFMAVILAVSTTALLLNGVTVAYNNDVSDGSSSARHDKPITIIPKTMAPPTQYAADFGGVACDSEGRTIKSHNTIFGLSTVGLHADTSFMNAVYEWNLQYVQDQSATNPALANPNDIPIGTKVKIMANCVSYNPVWEDYEYTSNKPNAKAKLVFERELVYQDYTGLTGQTHHLTTVDYSSNKNGALRGVIDCDPSPTCYAYVEGAPIHPPKNTDS
jgi:hypothetical protein